MYVVPADAADGHHGNGHGPADGLQGVVGHVVGVVLGPGGEHGPHAQIVRAVLFRQQSLLHRLGGHADDLIGPQLPADVQGLHVALAHMNAVGVHSQGNIHIVVDKKGNVIIPAQGLQLPGLCQERGLRQGLFPQLQHGDAAPQALLHHVPQGPAAEPVAVRNGVQQQVLFSAPHTWPPYPAQRRPCCRWRR